MSSTRKKVSTNYKQLPTLIRVNIFPSFLHVEVPTVDIGAIWAVLTCSYHA